MILKWGVNLGIISEMATAKVSRKKVGKTTTKKIERDRSQSLGAIWREVYQKQKGMMILMAVLLVMSLVLLIFSLTALRPQNTVVIVGYGDVYGELAGISGGYRRDSWLNMLAFPILAILLGVVHNILALRVYRKYGRDVAMVILVTSLLVVIGVGVTLLRLLGEW